MSDPGIPVELREVQATLCTLFRRREPVPADAEAVRKSAVHVTGNDRLTPAEQVDVYRRQYWMRHVDSLVEDYPATSWAVGEDTFDAFCRDYLDAFPPSAPSLRDLGADVVRFAEGWGGFGEHRALALDLVRYEHLLVDVFDGPDVPPVSATKLAALPEAAWETARVVLHPLLRLATFDHAVHRIRYAVRDGHPPEHAAAATPAPARLLVFRLDDVIRFEELGAEAYALLGALAAGVPLVPAMNDLAEARAAAGGDAAPGDLEALHREVGAWFRQWTGWGLIVDVALAPAAS